LENQGEEIPLVPEARPTIAKASNLSVVEQFFSRAPVPCVAALARDHGALIEFVLEDLERRLNEAAAALSV
jgi:hypothetical protein